METLIVSTKEGLRDAIRDVMREELAALGSLAGGRVVAERAPANEVPTRLAKQLLAEKGYRASSCVALNNVLREFGVVGKRRGKDNWYSVADLERVPAKI